MTPAFIFTPTELAGILLDKLIKDGKVKAPSGPFYIPEGTWKICTTQDAITFSFDPDKFVLGICPPKE